MLLNILISTFKFLLLIAVLNQNHRNLLHRKNLQIRLLGYCFPRCHYDFALKQRL